MIEATHLKVRRTARGKIVRRGRIGKGRGMFLGEAVQLLLEGAVRTGTHPNHESGCMGLLRHVRVSYGARFARLRARCASKIRRARTAVMMVSLVSM